MALLVYARLSTSQQKLTLQVSELKNAGVRKDRISTDMMTVATDEREGLQRLLVRAEKDDIIICTRMDRLGRSMADMILIVDACYKRGSRFGFWKTASVRKVLWGKMIIQILAAVAEAERERILERTNDGHNAAMVAGIRFGRKPHSATDLALRLIRQVVSPTIVTEQAGISRETYFRLKKFAISK